MHKTPTRQFDAAVPKSYPAESFHCTTCEMEIRGRPTFWVGLAFCCAGCAVHGPCTCSYDYEPDFDPDLIHQPQPGEREPVPAGPEPDLAEREPVPAGR